MSKIECAGAISPLALQRKYLYHRPSKLVERYCMCSIHSSSWKTSLYVSTVCFSGIECSSQVSIIKSLVIFTTEYADVFIKLRLLLCGWMELKSTKLIFYRFKKICLFPMIRLDWHYQGILIIWIFYILTSKIITTVHQLVNLSL